MERRKRFVLASIFLAGVYLVGRLIWTTWEWHYWGSLFLFLIVFLSVFFLFRTELSSWRERIKLAVLPSFFVLGLSLFSPLVTFHWWEEGFWLVLIIIGFYLLLLVENIFVVSLSFKTVPLYRAASVTGFLFSLLTSFFLFNTIFSLRFSPWVTGSLVFLVSWPLFYHLFWAAAISEGGKREIGVYASIASFLLGQFGLAVSFWPTGVSLAALYLVSLVYLIGGVIQAEIKERLFRRTLWEYIAVGVITFIALFLSLEW